MPFGDQETTTSAADYGAPDYGDGDDAGPSRLRTRAERRWIRTQAGVTLRDIADELGVDASALSRWESGNRVPRVSHFERYAQVLDRLEREAGDD